MFKEFSLNKEDGIQLITNILRKMKSIHDDDKGYYFYGGTKDNDIECAENLLILEDNETRLRKTFKNHRNWSNMRKSQKPVGNHLRFLFSKINETKTHKGICVKFGNYTCKKYYIPDCIKLDICIA